MADGGNPSLTTGNFTSAKGGLFGGQISLTGLDPNVAATLMGSRWTSDAAGTTGAKNFTYFFPTSAADFTTTPGYGGIAFDSYNAADQQKIVDSFTPLTAAQQSAMSIIFGQISQYTGATFTKASDGTAANAALRFVNYVDVKAPGGSEARFPTNNNAAYSPSDARVAGDNFEGGNAQIASGTGLGLDSWATLAHELGHALGLKHGHDTSLTGALSAARNDNEFSIMTYASYLGANTAGATEAIAGSSPQSFMMYDIAALQTMYGANFSKVGTSATYSWDAVTGQELINGAPAPNTGVTITNKIFETVWTAGAKTTYDLSNLNENGLIDLRPGQWLAFSSKQLADLNNQAPAGTAQFIAQGNVYNSLLFQGNTASEISNVILGKGNDIVTGNDLANKITGGGGSDLIDGGAGIDTAVYTGAAAQHTVTRSGSNIIIADTVANRDGTDTLVSVERAQFTDVTLAFDLTGDAGQGYRLYKAAFNRTPDQDGVTFWISNMDKGTGLKAVAQAFIDSAEYKSIYGTNPAAETIVGSFYGNVLGRTPDQAGLNFWISTYKAGMSTADLLINFSESAENQANTVAVVGNGITLTTSLLG